MPLPNNILNDVRGSSGPGTHSLSSPLNVFGYPYNAVHVSSFDLSVEIIWNEFSYLAQYVRPSQTLTFFTRSELFSQKTTKRSLKTFMLSLNVCKHL